MRQKNHGYQSTSVTPLGIAQNQNLILKDCRSAQSRRLTTLQSSIAMALANSFCAELLCRPTAMKPKLPTLTTVCRVSSSSESRQAQTRLARDDLLGLIATEERGLKTQQQGSKRAQIVKVIEALGVECSEQTTTDARLSGTWRMLWTTEKEQLFIIEKAPLLGTQAGDILQVIDVQRGTLNNVITFPPSGSFVVNSTIEVVSSQRVNFRFIRAALFVNGRRFAVPPFGKGWFESIYLDESIRVAKDIRGDFLVVDRAPYDWTPAPAS